MSCIAKHNSIYDDSSRLVSVFTLAYWLCLLLCERLDTLFRLTHGFCNKTAHVVERGEKMTHSACRGSKVTFYSGKLEQFMQPELRQTESKCAISVCPALYMNLDLNACSYSLTSRVNLRCHSQIDSGPGLNMSAPFIPAATALPFTSCHKGQRALTFGVQPSHWIIHDIDLCFSPYFFFPLSLFLVSTHGCAVGGFYSFSSFIKASPHLFVC